MNATTILIILGVIIVAGFLLKSKSGSKKSNSATNTTGWIIGPIINRLSRSAGMPARPTTQGQGWYFDFPNKGGHVNYVQWFDAPSLVGAKSITMRFAVSGSGFKALNDGSAPQVGLHFQRKGDDWSAKGEMQSYRWYSRNRPTLKAGEFTLIVPFVPEAWGDVYGQSSNVAGFVEAMRDLDNIAVVFGATAAGHGVYATEPSRFTLLGLEIVR